MESVVNKRLLYELADAHGVRHADSHYPSSMDDVHQIKDDLLYPVYAKPYEPHVWELTMAGMDKGVKAYSPAELVEAFSRLFAIDVEAMVQSIILGPASNVRTVSMYMDENSEPLAAMTTRKFRQYPAEFGTGSMAESYYDPELRDMGIDFFRSIKFRGFGTAEFKLDDRNNQ